MKQLKLSSTSENSEHFILNIVRHWLDSIEVNNRKVAKLICKLIPASCPFAREIKLFGHTFPIPAMCEFNPFYEELMSLRFRALTFLAEKSPPNNNF